MCVAFKWTNFEKLFGRAHITTVPFYDRDPYNRPLTVLPYWNTARSRVRDLRLIQSHYIETSEQHVGVFRALWTSNRTARYLTVFLICLGFDPTEELTRATMLK